MSDITKVVISFIFLFVLTFPLTIVLFNSYGLVVAFLFVITPLAWFVLDSELTHYGMDEFVK